MKAAFRSEVGYRGILLLIVISLVFIPALASAQIAPLKASDCGALGIACNPGDSPGTLRSYALTVINIFLGLVGVVALIFVILGGVRYISARGDEGEAETAKKTILYAVIGILVIGLAAVVVNFTLGAAGVGGELPGGSNLVGALLLIINVFLGLVGVTALIFVLYGGVRYITAQGDEGNIETAKRTILYAIIGLILVGLAAVTVNFTAAAVGLNTGIPASNNLPAAILTVINAFLLLAGLAALIFMIYAGVQYISSRGDTDKAESAKRTILFAVIGLIVIGVAAVVVNFVISIFFTYSTVIIGAFVGNWWYT